MFNAISRERLRELIAEKFPTLEPFTDLIYEEAGETFVRLEDGSWTTIPVTEGFSQGCPFSPTFAAIVLNDILTQIQPELETRAKHRLLQGNKGDDDFGSLGFVFSYVDDTNAVLHHDDVRFFLDKFCELGIPLGAVLNTTKTRILTSTSGTSLIDKMLNGTNPTITHIRQATALRDAIATYSTTKSQDGITHPCEVTDGLRILGAPIGSYSFCQTFIMNTLNQASQDAVHILTKLDDLQTSLRIFSMCTAHKVTHLFSHDVLNANLDELPSNFWLWDSPMTARFNDMTADFIANITKQQSLPTHSQLISNISIREGGLGIKTPRTCAINTYMSNCKRCLQYSTQGVWLGFNKPRPQLPTPIKILYQDWETSNSRTWSIFRKYLPTFNSITVHEPQNPTDYVFKASLNASREKVIQYSSNQIKNKILYNPEITSDTIRTLLPSLLDQRSSLALMTMSRINDSHRIKNHTFRTALQRKLRLPIIDNITDYKCKCGSSLDLYGDHCLGCKANHKSKTSNGIRDEIIKVFQRILPFVGMIDTGTQVESEVHNIVPSLPRLQPFDLSIRLDHSLDSGHWKTPYHRIGFDVTIIHSTKKSSATPSEAAQYNEYELRLRDGEKMKFARPRGGTNPITNKTITPDDVIGEIIQANHAFIPIAVGPFGEFGSLFRRFLENYNTLPLPQFAHDRPNAMKAAKIATNFRTPYNVLGKADQKWKAKFSDTLFDGSYHAGLPSTWANQKLGLATVTHLSNHINTSLTRLTLQNRNSSQEIDSDSDSCYDGDGWNFFDGELSNNHDDLDIFFDGEEDVIDPGLFQPIRQS
jgi:hypothetical protein